MTLRTKTLLTFTLTVGAVVAVFYLTARTILMDSFRQMEEQHAAQELQHVLNTLDEQEQILRVMVEEWTAREDMYQFASNPDGTVIPITLRDEVFTTHHVDLIAVARPDGAIVFAEAYDHTRQQPIPIPEGFDRILAEESDMLDGSGSRSSLMALPSMPILAAAAPIRRDEDEPAVGYLIWGRLLGAEFAHEIAGGATLDLTFYPAAGADVPEDVAAAVGAMPAGETQIVRPRDDDQISAYAILEDASGRPAVIVRASQPRTIYAQGRLTDRALLTVLLGIGAFVSTLGILLMERLVLARLRRLDRSVEQIGISGARVNVQGGDEVARLASTINQALTALEASQNSTEESERRLHMVVHSAPVLLVTLDCEGRFTFVQGGALSSLVHRPEIGDTLDDVAYLPPDARELLRRVLKGEELVTIFDYDGVILDLHAAPLRNEHGEIVGAIGVATDITERGAAQRTLEDTLENYRRLFENSRDTIFATTRDATILRMNPAGVQMFGFEQDMAGLNMVDRYVNPADRARFQELIESQGSVRDFEVTLQRQDGTPIDCLITAAARRNADGSTAGYEGIIRDITVGKQALRALRQSEERFRSVFEAVPIGMALTDREGRLIEANLAFLHLLGYSGEDVRGQNFLDFTYPTDRDESRELLTELLSGKRDAYTVEKRFTRKSGDLIWARMRVVRFYGGESRSEFLIAMVEDITEQRRADEAEEDQRTLLEALSDTATALNSTLDLDEVFDRILANAAHVVPHDASSIMLIELGSARVVRRRGYSDLDSEQSVLSLRLPLETTQNLSTMMATRQPLIIEDTQSYPGWLEVTALQWVRSVASAPIFMDEVVIGFLNLECRAPHFFTPAHAPRLQAFADQAGLAIKNARLYEEMVHHAAQLEERNRELDAFSHTVAHDLKSPLQVVLGYANLLNTDYRNEISSEVSGLLQYVEAYALKMNRMIESILLLSQLRSAEQIISEVEVRPIVQEVLSRLERAVAQRRIEVLLEGDFPSVLGNSHWLEEVFANLIDNAVKYIGEKNAEPRITIRGGESGGQVRYEVRDNGIGIQAQDQAKLFEMFTRFHNREAKGSGLGLSIVRRIISKLGGEIGVESEPGQGSTFWFTLPAARPQPDGQESNHSTAI